VSTFFLVAAFLLAAYWLVDVIRNMLTQRASERSTAWADRDCIELWDAACLMAGKPPNASFEQEPQRTYHRRLKDAINKGQLVVLEMRDPHMKPNMKTLVTRKALQVYAKTARWPKLRELLRQWDKLNPPQLASGLPELPLKR
jgi:hypothetical protein